MFQHACPGTQHFQQRQYSWCEQTGIIIFIRFSTDRKRLRFFLFDARVVLKALRSLRFWFSLNSPRQKFTKNVVIGVFSPKLLFITTLGGAVSAFLLSWGVASFVVLHNKSVQIEVFFLLVCLLLFMWLNSDHQKRSLFTLSREIYVLFYCISDFLSFWLEGSNVILSFHLSLRKMSYSLILR